MPRSDVPTPARERQAEHLRRTHRIRTVPRPLVDGGSFELAYTRTGPPSQTPLLVIPGGPGLASVLPYAGFRRRAERLGLDVIMIEHRGIGLSRTSPTGSDLPLAEMRISRVLDDIEAVLDAENVDRAVVYGTSYGSYVAQRFGARHPTRVAALVLDSAFLDASSSAASSRALHDLYWNAVVPGTRSLAMRVRGLADRGMLPATGAGFTLQLLHEFGGPPVVSRYLTLLEGGRGGNFSRWSSRLGKSEVERVVPFQMEFDLVGEIAFRELDYGGDSVELRRSPLALASQFDALAHRFTAFKAPAVELAAALPGFSWPTIVVTGDRDIRTPRSAAERIASLVPGAALLAVQDHGHSALDTQQALAMRIMVAVATGLADPGGIAARLPEVCRGRRGIAARVVAARLAAATLPFAR